MEVFYYLVFGALGAVVAGLELGKSGMDRIATPTAFNAFEYNYVRERREQRRRAREGRVAAWTTDLVALHALSPRPCDSYASASSAARISLWLVV